MDDQESPIVFECAGERLIGILARPCDQSSSTGVLIVVGGPQYRAGSHRQFTLLARYLAEHGFANLRFDYRGMGDSEGEQRTFETIDADIDAAITAFLQHHSGIESVALWGLCDAASAALMYAHLDPRVKGLILLNPWAHTDESGARARLRYYYVTRLFQRSFWSKLFSGQMRIGASVRELLSSIRTVFRSMDRQTKNSGETMIPVDMIEDSKPDAGDFLERMLLGLRRFQGSTTIILSGQDLTAKEFAALGDRHREWKKAFAKKSIVWRRLPDANHTFSSADWRGQVESMTLGAIQQSADGALVE